MKAALTVLAILVGAFSLSPFLIRPAAAGTTRAGRHHDCCCPACPGPGLCPCDPGESRGASCEKAGDDLPANVETPSAPSPLKLSCDLPTFPDPPRMGERPADAARSPLLPVFCHSLEKVPISVA